MNYKECIPMVIQSRCAQTGISESDVRCVFDAMRPKMDEAEANLKRREMSLESMYCAFDTDEVVREAGDLDRMHMYPRLAPSVAAWSGVFNKTLGNQTSDLTHAERLAMKMINYMVYTECVYANLVNQLCYVLANSNSPRCFKELGRKSDMAPIARNVRLSKKIIFLKHNLPDVQPDVPSITDACDGDLRNMIAHGSLAGNQPPPSCTNQQKPKQQNMSEQVYVRRSFKGGWKWEKNSLDLDVAYKDIHDATLIWHNALWCYWDMKFGPEYST